MPKANAPSASAIHARDRRLGPLTAISSVLAGCITSFIHRDALDSPAGDLPRGVARVPRRSRCIHGLEVAPHHDPRGITVCDSNQVHRGKPCDAMATPNLGTA